MKRIRLQRLCDISHQNILQNNSSKDIAWYFFLNKLLFDAVCKDRNLGRNIRLVVWHVQLKKYDFVSSFFDDSYNEWVCGKITF